MRNGDSKVSVIPSCFALLWASICLLSVDRQRGLQGLQHPPADPRVVVWTHASDAPHSKINTVTLMVIYLVQETESPFCYNVFDIWRKKNHMFDPVCLQHKPLNPLDLLRAKFRRLPNLQRWGDGRNCTVVSHIHPSAAAQVSFSNCWRYFPLISKHRKACSRPRSTCCVPSVLWVVETWGVSRSAQTKAFLFIGDTWRYGICLHLNIKE